METDTGQQKKKNSLRDLYIHVAIEVLQMQVSANTRTL